MARVLHLGGNVARFELAQHLVDEDAVRHLSRDLGEMLVAAMHGVARLEGRDLRPAAPFELGARFLGPQIETLVFCRILTLRKRNDGAADVDFALPHHLLHAGMLGIGGAKHVLAFELAIDGVFLPHRELAEHLAGLGIGERDLLADGEAVGNAAAPATA